jgi:microcystin-dependent protein
VARAAYPGLFAAIGVAYGAGDGATTFALPDLRGRVIVGAGAGAGLTARAVAAAGGAETVNLSLAQTPAHAHTVNSHAHGTSSNVDQAHQHGGTTADHDRTHYHGLEGHHHAINHWHYANVGNVHWNATQTHGHHDRGGILSEAPWEGANWAGATAVNVQGNAEAAPGGRDISGREGWPTGWQGANTGHLHGFSTDWRLGGHTHTMAAEAPGTNAQGGGTAHENMPPFLSTTYLIKT